MGVREERGRDRERESVCVCLVLYYQFRLLCYTLLGKLQNISRINNYSKLKIYNGSKRVREGEIERERECVCV